MPVFLISVGGANVNFQRNCCLVECAASLAELLVALVRSFVPGQAGSASKGAQAARTLVRRLLVRAQMPLHHGSFEERLAAHTARDAIQHEVLRTVLVKVRPLVEPLAAFKTVEAFRLIDGLQHPGVTVAQVLRVIRIAVVLRLAREAVNLHIRVRRGEVVQVGALVHRVSEADDAGEARRAHPSAFEAPALIRVQIVRIVGCICRIAVERRIQKSCIVPARLAPFLYIDAGTLVVA